MKNRTDLRREGKQKVTERFRTILGEIKAEAGPNGSMARNDLIILPSGKVSFTECATNLFAIVAKYRELFLFGGRVVEVIKSGLDNKFALSPLGAQAFRSRIEHYGQVMAYRAGPHEGQVLLKPNARCSLDTANCLLETEERRLLPSITLIHNCPILTEHGMLRKGYHAVCGGRMIKSAVVPEEISLPEARKILLEAIAEFDFLEASDRSRAMAAIISPALKFGELLKAHFPLFMVEADLSTAGKGFLLELIQAIYRELAAIVAKLKGGVGGFDESLAQKLINGRPFIQFDNIRGRIDSQYLEAILTAPYGETVAARIPYKPEIQVRPDRFIFQLTSNGFTIRVIWRIGLASSGFARGMVSPSSGTPKEISSVTFSRTRRPT